MLYTVLDALTDWDLLRVMRYHWGLGLAISMQCPTTHCCILTKCSVMHQAIWVDFGSDFELNFDLISKVASTRYN
jgi:hypothetical protein